MTRCPAGRSSPRRGPAPRVFTLAAVPALIDPATRSRSFFAVSVVLFLAGCALFMVDLVLAAARSRDDAMGIGGLFFLAGSAPTEVQRHLLGSLAVQVARRRSSQRRSTRSRRWRSARSCRPSGWRCAGLWAVRHGLFPPRT